MSLSTHCLGKLARFRCYFLKANKQRKQEWNIYYIYYIFIRGIYAASTSSAGCTMASGVAKSNGGFNNTIVSAVCQALLAALVNPSGQAKPTTTLWNNDIYISLEWRLPPYLYLLGTGEAKYGNQRTFPPCMLNTAWIQTASNIESSRTCVVDSNLSVSSFVLTAPSANITYRRQG